MVSNLTKIEARK